MRVIVQRHTHMSGATELIRNVGLLADKWLLDIRRLANQKGMGSLRIAKQARMVLRGEDNGLRDDPSKSVDNRS
jgi:hypothetical protein